jgi:hypothetical protein
MEKTVKEKERTVKANKNDVSTPTAVLFSSGELAAVRGFARGA